MLGNRCLCDCYGNWPPWGGPAGALRGAAPEIAPGPAEGWGWGLGAEGSWETRAA